MMEIGDPRRIPGSYRAGDPVESRELILGRILWKLDQCEPGVDYEPLDVGASFAALMSELDENGGDSASPETTTTRRSEWVAALARHHSISLSIFGSIATEVAFRMLNEYSDQFAVRLANGTQGERWAVSWLPEQDLSFEQAFIAMALDHMLIACDADLGRLPDGAHDLARYLDLTPLRVKNLICAARTPTAQILGTPHLARVAYRRIRVEGLGLSQPTAEPRRACGNCDEGRAPQDAGRMERQVLRDEDDGGGQLAAVG